MHLTSGCACILDALSLRTRRIIPDVRGPIPEITGIPMVSLTPRPLWCEFYRELAADVHIYLYRGRDGIKCGKVNNASGWRARSARLFALAGTWRGQTG